MLHPSFHVGVEFPQGCLVAILPEQHIKSYHQGGGPCHVVGIVVPECGSHVGDAAVLALCLADVAHPFGIEVGIVEDVGLAIAATGAVAEPGLALVALRTVNRQSLVIAQDAPPRVLVHLVERGIAGGHHSGGTHLVGDHLAHEIAQAGIPQSADLGIAETVVDECGVPPGALFLSVGIVAVGAPGMTEVLGPDVSRGVEPFGKTDNHAVAWMQTAHPHLQPSRHVLSHVEYHLTVFLRDGHWRHLPDDLHVGGHCPAQGAKGYGGALGFHPSAVVEASTGPSVPHLAGVIHLSVVLVVRAYGPIGIQPPFLVGGDGLGRAVGKNHDEVQAQGGIAETGNLVGFLVLLHRVVAAIAKHHADGVVAAKQRGHVVTIVEHGAAIVGGSGGKHVVAHTLAIDVGLIHTQSADVESGVAHLLVERELLAQVAGTQLAVLFFHVPGHGMVVAYPSPFPVGLCQQSHVPHGGLAPVAVALGGAHLHAPVAAGIAAQTLAVVLHPLRLVGLQGGVPKVTFQRLGLLGSR